MRPKSALMVSLISVGLAACSTTNFSELPAGKFSGSLIVMWVGEGGSSGAGRFVYLPDRKAPLVFRRAKSDAPGSVITPGVMYTDGGSIPSFAQAFKGFSPWGYAPAYMIHDWLFTARLCLTDGHTSPDFAALRDVTFADSAQILGEAIQTLVEEKRVQQNDLAGSTITTAVDSGIAKGLWDRKGACESLKVDPKYIRAAEDAQLGRVGRFRAPGGLTARAVSKVDLK